MADVGHCAPRPPFVVLFHLYLFFHVYLVALAVIEFVCKQRSALVGGDVYAEAILHLPPCFDRDKPLVDVCCYIGVYMQVKPANLQFLYQVVYFVFQCVCKQY